MEKIRKPAVVNKFYSGNPVELSNQIYSFGNNNYNNTKYKSRAVIIPHAGLVYSGKLAYEGINQLDKNIKTAFIFAPAHTTWFDGIAVSSFDKWETPLGYIDVNKNLTHQLIEKYGAIYNDDALCQEHSIEVEIPIIQSILGNIKIVPVLIANQTPELITQIIQEYFYDKEIGFIVSSDLSHYLTDEEAKKLDSITANMIESANFLGAKREQACGMTGIIGLSNFAKQNDFSLIRLDMINSSFVTNDVSSVVGYGTWFLYEGERNNYIKEYHSDFILNLVYKALETSFTNEQIHLKYPQVLDEIGACFVTLEKQGRLRGCIGSMSAYQSLIKDIVNHSYDAAFKDTRFNPVTQDELGDISISVSLLSQPKPIDFIDEEDLLNKIVPLKDGIIIRDGQYSAVYLPIVWEQLPDKKEFLNSLKVKAGLTSDYFSDTFQAFRFYTVYISKS